MSFLFPAARLSAKSQIAIDEPASFKLLEPKTISDTAKMLSDHGTEAVALAGGCDIFEKIKTQWIRPKYVVNLKGVLDKKVEAQSIGAGATLAHVATNSALPQALREAALKVATPQIRNMGTLGGNLLQDSRCPYYRGPWHCYRAGGITCDAVRGYTHEHALWGGERCYTVHPSDTAPALVALCAQVEVASAEGSRTMPIEDLFALPSYDITSLNKLKRGEILTRVLLPATKPNQRSVFRKAALRQTWDFALTSVAVSAEVSGWSLRNVHIVLGAVAPIPWRAKAAETAIEGKGKTAIEDAVRAAVNGAEPLPHNHYKIGLVKNLVRECLEEITKG